MTLTSQPSVRADCLERSALACVPATIGAGGTRTGNYDAAFPFLLGRYASVATNFNYDVSGAAFPLGTGKNRDYRYDEYEFYVQDNWKMRSDLTLTYGVRWHFYPAPYEKDGFQAAQDTDMRQLFDLRQRNAAAGISRYQRRTLPSLRPGWQGQRWTRPLYEHDVNNFGPRLSFAYNPSFKDGILGQHLRRQKNRYSRRRLGRV